MFNKLFRKSLTNFSVALFVLWVCAPMLYWRAYSEVTIYNIGVMSMIITFIMCCLFGIVWWRHYCGKCKKSWVFHVVADGVIDASYNPKEGCRIVKYVVELECENCAHREIKYKIKKRMEVKNV